MITVYICPDCRCEHDEPADAGYALEARCFDCTHLIAIASVRPARARDAVRRLAPPARRVVVRKRDAA